MSTKQETIRARPAIQNIPLGSETGKRLSDAFNRHGLVTFELDYAEVEQRLLARYTEPTT